MNTKSVLIVSSEFPPGPGGIGRHAADFSLALAEKKWQVVVFSSVDYAGEQAINSFIKELHPNIVLHRFKRMGLMTYPARIINVLRAVRNIDYSRLVFTGKFPLWLGGLIKLLYGDRKKIEFFVHGSEINPDSFFSRMLTHWALKKSDRIWAVSNYTKSILPESVRKYKDVYILPNGIHQSQWRAHKDIESHKKWQGQPRLLTVGSITPRKGQHRVINLLPTLLDHYPSLHYHLVGMESKTEKLDQSITRHGLENYVTVHGRLPGQRELAAAYRSADVFIMLSEPQADGDVEGFGIAILEANLHGLPAIGAKGCGIEDAIKPGVNGELVDGNDPVEVKEALNKILQNPHVYRKNMTEWVAQHDWQNLIEEFITVE